MIEKLAAVESSIETLVWDMFELTDAMRDTVRDYRSPAELLGLADADMPGDDEAA